MLRPYKGVKYLLKAFESLPKEVLEDSRLLIVGETWEDNETMRLITNSKYKEKITIVNRYVPDDEVSLYFSACDVVVLPYTRASQSGVTHIAMAFGLPVISTSVGGLKESLSRYKGAVFVKPKKVDELVKAIAEVYKSRRKKFQYPGEVRWNEVAKRWINMLKQL